MSKIGAKPITIKEGISVSEEDGKVVVRGPLGEVKLHRPFGLKFETVDNLLFVKRINDDKKTKSNHGTMARLIANAILGTTVGFEKSLEIVGTGYRGQMEGNTLVLALGYSHPVRFESPSGIIIKVVENKIKVSGIDKEIVCLTADKIKRLRKPDPYKGKGIRYEGEKLKLKPGKVAAKAGATAAK